MIICVSCKHHEKTEQRRAMKCIAVFTISMVKARMKGTEEMDMYLKNYDLCDGSSALRDALQFLHNHFLLGIFLSRVHCR